MLILSLRDPLQNQSLETIQVCIVVSVFTCVMNVRDQTRQAFATGSGPFCDSTSKFIHGP